MKSKFCKSFCFFQIHNVFAQSLQVQLLGFRVEKKVAQVQFMVMELQQKNIVLVVIIMNFHGGQNVVHGSGIRTWVKIVVFQNQVQVNYLHGTFYYYTSLPVT